MGLFDHVVVPVADGEDAEATALALIPYLDDIGRLTVVHVIEKGGGVVDKAPMEKRRADAETFFAAVDAHLKSLDTDVPVDTRLVFGTDVAETLVETAVGLGATAIAFRPRGGGRLVRWLSGDTATRLVTDADLPVVSFAAQETWAVRDEDDSSATTSVRDGGDDA